MLEQFAEGEAKQFAAMKELQGKGVTLHYWPKDILATYEKTWNEVAVEQSAKSPEFKKAWDSYSAFRAGYKLWREYGYLKQQ
jgi:TRAP-type mannitol/chloroaromatic compound transport system substrate-binding protein